MGDRFDLERFVEAQAEVYEQACAELRAGRKRSHWMWFVFPQIRGLGSSEMAVKYGISGQEEARAYPDASYFGAEAIGVCADCRGAGRKDCGGDLRVSG